VYGKIKVRIFAGGFFMKVPEIIREVIEKIADYPVWIVGGAVRDMLLGRSPKDWDILTEAPFAFIQDKCPELIPTGIKHGTVKVLRGSQTIEITSLAMRGLSLAEDLRRRDFTINAIAYSLREERVVDLYGGREDLRAGVLRLVENNLERFREDPLRLMRGVRFSVEYGLQIHPDTEKQIRENACFLNRVSIERIREEFSSLLMGKKPWVGMKLLEEFGLLSQFLPELSKTKGCRQSPPHHEDVFNHSLSALALTGSILELRLAALLHDIGKPSTATVENGKFRFFGHHVAGAQICREVLTRLRYGKKTVSRVERLVRYHMFEYSDKMTDRALFRLINKVGEEEIYLLIQLRLADRLSILPDSDVSLYEGMENRIRKLMEEGRKLKVTDLKINGVDVQEIMGLKPGREVGQVLRKMLLLVQEGVFPNEREVLMEKLRDLAVSWGTEG
jgi:putative nucleotidyltransferase with HDIG domain